jgi:hypothetical protein
MPNILDFLPIPGIFKDGLIQKAMKVFNEAYDDARKFGKILGYLIPKIFKGFKINLVAFSLGTVLVQSTLDYLKQNNNIHIINRVILMGGAADK